MANVVDPNSWRMIPSPEAPGPGQPHGPRSPEIDGERTAPGGSSPDKTAPVALLWGVLARWFTGAEDRVVWNLACPADPTLRMPGRRVRFDAEHEPSVPAAAGLAAAEPSTSELDAPWLVLVEDARELSAAGLVDRLRAQRAKSEQLLVVACDLDEPAADVAGRSRLATEHAAELAARLRCDYVGPVDANVAGELREVVDRVKRAGRPTLVYLNARQHGAPVPHFVPPPGAATPAVQTDVLREIALDAVAELARSNRRIIMLDSAAGSNDAASSERPGAEATVQQATARDALRRCADAARSGERPFLLLSAAEAQDHLGQIRRAICAPRLGVTLILESRDASGTSGENASASLAGVRQLPHVSLLAPKDGTELRQMLQWCATQSDPAVVWLPEELEPQVTWPRGAEICLGQAEPLGQGPDVTIIAWGPMAAAAAIAAESLSQRGIGATVVNARFAQPLDIESIAAVTDRAACIVVVDDAAQGGGFAGWMSEQLLQAGIRQPLAIVSPPVTPHSSPHLRHDQCALAIVQRCAGWPSRRPAERNCRPKRSCRSCWATWPSTRLGWTPRSRGHRRCRTYICKSLRSNSVRSSTSGFARTRK